MILLFPKCCWCLKWCAKVLQMLARSTDYAVVAWKNEYHEKNISLWMASASSQQLLAAPGNSQLLAAVGASHCFCINFDILSLSSAIRYALFLTLYPNLYHITFVNAFRLGRSQHIYGSMVVPWTPRAHPAASHFVQEPPRCLATPRGASSIRGGSVPLRVLNFGFMFFQQVKLIGLVYLIFCLYKLNQIEFKSFQTVWRS